MSARVSVIGLLWLLLVSAASAQDGDGVLRSLAEAYERSLVEVGVDDTPPADLLATLNDARRSGNAAEMLRVSEELVRRDQASTQAWLQLARAWLLQDGASSSGLGAAVRASELAEARGDRAEALLLASSFLRSRLDLARARYDAARAAATAAVAGLDQLERIARDDRSRQVADADDPEARRRMLETSRAEAEAQAGVAADDISQAAAALDEIYTALQDSLPGVDAEQLRLADSRISFDLKRDDQGFDQPLTVVEVDHRQVRACVEFTRPLGSDHLAYRPFVDVMLNDGSSDWTLTHDAYDLQTEGSRLCVLRLEPGTDYQLIMASGLPSADGQSLQGEETIYISMFDLPTRVGFGDAEFILPPSGPGELPVYLTNADGEIPLHLHRIADRSLNRHLALGHIRNGIPNREHRDLIARFSETLWEGSASRPIAEDERNRVVRSFIPVRTILDDRAQWLRQTDWSDRDGIGELRSVETAVRGISDEHLSVRGQFVGDAFAAEDGEQSRFQPGIYVLVARVPETGQSHERYCFDDGDDCAVFTTQWFMTTSMGLSFYEGDTTFAVVARSLETGAAVEGARIELVSQGNRVLGEAVTDANGVASFERSLTAGRGSNQLIAILAQTEDDFSFVKYGSERLDLSRLNVGGHASDQGLGALLYTDRGIYQPGETISTLALLRRRSAIPAETAELRLQISDHAVTRRPLSADDWKNGGALVDIAIPASARAGSASLTLVTASGEELASARVDIGRIRPDRARLRFDEAGVAVTVDASGGLAEIRGGAQAQYLYGAENSTQAPASGLKAEITVRVSPVATPLAACHAGFGFGAFDDETLPVVSRNYTQYTGRDGRLDFTLAGVRLPQTSRPLSATVEVTLFDASGPIASRQTEVRLPVRQLALGIAELPRLVPADGGYRIDLPVIAIGPDGRAASGRQVELVVEREQEFYAWENVDGSWQHIRTRQREEVARRMLDLPASAGAAEAACPEPAMIEGAASNLPDGRYVIGLRDAATGAFASTRFNTGVTQTSPDDLEPNIFMLSADSDHYAPGDTIELTVAAPFEAGEALVAIAGADVEAWHSAPIAQGRATISFTADASLAGRGWYALAFAYKADDGAEARLGPARAVGAAHFEVSDDRTGFELAITRRSDNLDDFLRPRETLDFDVCVTAGTAECAADAPEGIHAVAFVVDEGLLGLTGHEANAERVEQAFAGREALKLRVMDNYGRLLLREGGDLPGRLALNNYTSNRIVAHASGPVELRDGRASFSFDDPGLNSGSLSIYVVAWSLEHLASARQTVPVRQYLVSELGLPDFFLAGDRPVLPLRLENISFAGHEGAYALALDAGPDIAVALLGSDGAAIEAGSDGRFSVPIPLGEPQDLFVTLDLPRQVSGSLDIGLSIEAVGAAVDLPQEERERRWDIDVRPAGVEAQRYLSFPLGERPVDLAALLQSEAQDFEPATATVTARFASDADALRLASLSGSQDPGTALDRLVWEGFVRLQETAGAEQRSRLQQILDNVQALQFVDGAFVPYRTDGEFVAAELGAEKEVGYDVVRHGLMRSAAAVDLLTRARNAGLSVSPAAISRGQAYLETRVGATRAMMNPVSDCSFETHYAMLVLIEANRFDNNLLHVVRDCMEPDEDGADENDWTIAEAEPMGSGAFAGLVSNAVLTRYGEVTDPEALLAQYYGGPDDYLDDLDPYRKAIAVSMLASAGGDRSLLDELAGDMLDDGSPALDLRSRAWLARAAADLGPSPLSEPLAASSLVPSHPDVLALADAAPGIVESREMPLVELAASGVTVAATPGIEGRGHVRLAGRLIAEAEQAAPSTGFRQRFFDAHTGAEFDIESAALEVGDNIVVVVEASADVTAMLDTGMTPDLGLSFAPLLVDVAMPSAFAVTSDRLTEVPPDSELAELAMFGNLRSVASDVQQWTAIVVPESMRREAEKRVGEEEGEAVEAPVEFRQAFTARVTAAGDFAFPSSTIDAVEAPGTTAVSRPLQFRVAIPGRSTP
jgi:uncharacterized protein YfaS (alpha-2-macroglobulin family)